MIFLRISCIKYAKDTESFRVLENFGAKVVKLDNPEDVDSEIKNLYANNYKTIILSNEIASFSEDIIKKYNSTENISIIIAPKKFVSCYSESLYFIKAVGRVESIAT